MRRGRLQINPGALVVVPAERRKTWENLAREVAIEVSSRFRKKWTTTETLRVVLADPSESYEGVAREIDRTPGAVRYRRMAMVHLLREEHGARERAEAYRGDPKNNHKHHDYFQVDEILREYGFYDLPVSDQFALAQPLQQPTAAWRGDGTSAALRDSQMASLRDEIRRLLRTERDSRPRLGP